MAINILISEPDQDWKSKISKYLEGENFVLDFVTNGKAAQTSLYRNKKISVVVLDIFTENHSAFEVLKYIRLNAPSAKVILTVESKKTLEQFDLSKDDLTRLGVSDILFKTYSKEQFIKSIDGELQFEFTKGKQENSNDTGPQKIAARDDEFTRIKLADYCSGNTAIFDLFIRISEGHYVKVVHAGDYLNEAHLAKYNKGAGGEWIYFKTKDRKIYIAFMNKLLESITKNGGVKIKRSARVKMVKNLSDKFVEEIYTVGIKPSLIEEGNKICRNVTDLIKRETKLFSILRTMQESEPSIHSHCSTVSFFSAVVCNNLKWASKSTIEKITIGGMFHDLGKLKINKSCLNLSMEEMDAQQLQEYKMHPELGVAMLDSFKTIEPATKQIIYQHHETIDGKGFPRGITGIKIYPLAQVVGLVDLYVNFMAKHQLPPVVALRKILKEQKDIIGSYHPNVIRALMSSFIDKQKFNV